MSDTNTLLSVKNLSVFFKTPSGQSTAVDNVSFDIAKKETMALVGESGSGKSVSALSITQLLPYPMASHDKKSSITFRGEELIGKKETFMRTIRGRQIGMIFQEPLTALNPLHNIRRQIGEVLKLHQGMNKDAAETRILELMDLVGLPKLRDRLGAYPHELSGGQRQRIMIAMALANNPDLLIADEPTTALDVTIQAQILELLDDLKQRLNMSLLMITHDLSIVEKMADHVCVMQHGKLVEKGATKALFSSPKEPYTKMLLNARPQGIAEPIKTESPIVLEGKNINVSFSKKKNFFGKTTEWLKAVDDVSLKVKQGETLGIVGESGSGKTTLGLALLRLQSSEGQIVFQGNHLETLSRKQSKPYRSQMQIVFQDPFGSLSPRMSVSQIIEEGLKIHKGDLSPEARDESVIEALTKVHLDPKSRHRYPHEFSGGQRQRISIARALVLKPAFIVLDEPTSALDVSVQAEIVDLLRKIQKEENIAFIFISHDLRVVRAMSHNLIVMKDGQIMEQGKAVDIFENPQHEYTKTLLDAAMNLKARAS